MTVYFIQAGESGPVKIGQSKNADGARRRLYNLQIGSPTRLRMLAVTDEHDEAPLHIRFAEHRIRGEWFEPAEDLVEFIGNLPPAEPAAPSLPSPPSKRVIMKCGGHDVVADWCGVTVTQTYRWTYPKEKSGGTGGLIPSEHIQTIMERAHGAGIALTHAEFFPPVNADLKG